MKIFIDTANIEQIKKANDMGLIDGVTTNPSLVSKENKTRSNSTNLWNSRWTNKCRGYEFRHWGND